MWYTYVIVSTFFQDSLDFKSDTYGSSDGYGLPYLTHNTIFVTILVDNSDFNVNPHSFYNANSWINQNTEAFEILHTFSTK